MPQKRANMKKIKRLIQLLNEAKLNNRELASILNISASTVSYYSRAIKNAKIIWPLADNITDNELLQKLEPFCPQLKKSTISKSHPCWETIHKEMSHKHITIRDYKSLVYYHY